MDNYKIINIKNRPELIENAAVWFQDKRRVPADEYRKSMEESLESAACTFIKEKSKTCEKLFYILP